MSLDRYERSAFYKSSGHRLRCPFCGERMDFNDPVPYEEGSNSWFWDCRECALTIGDIPFLTEQLTSKIRKEYLEHLKKMFTKKTREAEWARSKIDKWGKHMSSKEKVRLLAEKLEIEESDVES